MKVIDGKVYYPTYRCRECQLMVMHEPNNTCDECIRHGATPPPPKSCEPYDWMKDWTHAP